MASAIELSLALALAGPAGSSMPDTPAPPATPAPRLELASQERTYEAVRAIDPIVVDGKPRERTWQLAPLDDRFTEREPELGGKPPVRTTLRVAYDDDSLYVFLDASSEPGDVIVRTLRRDNSGIFADDAVYVKLDPTHNRRNGMSFGVNAECAQIDALGLEDGREFITEWDAVWDAECVRHEAGFTAEFRIPFVILGIKRADQLTMGLEISRDHPSRNATYDWRLIVPPRSPMAASQFGELVGLRDIRAGRAIEYTPYVLGRTNFTPDFTVDPRLRPNFATGGDVRLQVGATSYVEASLLTDFAQVEADEVQVARDRFPLFFPERRPFFINGLDVFNFGRPREAQLFFSRKVGLESGQQVPLLGGVKLYGRTRVVSYGLLQVQTLGSPSDPSRGLVEADPTNVTVARVRVQATKQLNVGMMMLGEHRFGVENADDSAGGFDAQVIALGGKLVYYGFVAGTWAQSPAQPATVDPATGTVLSGPVGADRDIGSSAYSQLEYRGLYVRPSALWLWSDRDFQPVLGFYRRPGTSRQELALDLVPRPRVLGLREIAFGPRYSIETDPGYGNRLGQSATGAVGLQWRNGSEANYEISHFVDRVQAPFTLYLHTVEAQRYSGFRHRVDVSSPSRRVVGVNASYEFIELFGGAAHQPNLGTTMRLGKHFTLGASYTHLVGRLQDRDERFNFGYMNGNVDIAITRNLAFDNLVRLDLSPANPRFALQSRLRWRFLAGSDIYLVYRTNVPLGADPIDFARAPFHELTVKLTYYLRSFFGR